MSTVERRTIKVLDAGCGREQKYVSYPDAHIVGLDTSSDALALNTTVDEKLVGDLQSYPLPENEFDVVLCWDVLEHLPRPDRAFANMARALRPGGEMIIGLPNLMSPKGLLTKFTPHRFHVWVYRRLFHKSHAGRPGYGPFKTYLRWSIRPKALVRAARSLGLEVKECELQSPTYFERWWDSSWRHRLVWHALRSTWWAVSLGGDARLTEVKLVLRKPGLDEPAERVVIA